MYKTQNLQGPWGNFSPAPQWTGASTEALQCAKSDVILAKPLITGTV